jgi:hypothetical protein
MVKQKNKKPCQCECEKRKHATFDEWESCFANVNISIDDNILSSLLVSLSFDLLHLKQSSKQRHPNADDINLYYCQVCFSTFINPNGLKKHIKTNVRMSFRFEHFRRNLG